MRRVGQAFFFLKALWRLCEGFVRIVRRVGRRQHARQHTQQTSAYAAYVCIRSVRQQGSIKASAKSWASEGSVQALVRLLRLCEGPVVKVLLTL